MFNVLDAQLFAALLSQIAQNVSDERAAKFGYDILNGIAEGNVIDRYEAWVDWWKPRQKHLEQHGNLTNFVIDECDAERNGVWVPAIPMKYDPLAGELEDEEELDK